MSSVDTSNLKSLGENSKYEAQDRIRADLLEAFASPLKQDGGFTGSISMVSSEFTSLCPKTGQPDFATIKVDYTPNDLCVESKSYKLYLGSFRNVGEFHEACTQRIADDLVKLLRPKWLCVKAEFTPRGGIPFWPTVTYWEQDEAKQSELPLESDGTPLFGQKAWGGIEPAAPANGLKPV